VVQRFTANITSTTKAALTKPVAKLTPEEKRRREMAAEDERTDKKWKQIDLARSRVAAREKAIVEGKRKQAKRLRKPSGTGPTQAAIAYRERISKGLSSGASTRASQDELARELALKRGKGAKKSIDNAYDCTSSAAAAKQKAAAAAEKQRQKNIKAQHKLRKAEAENAGKTRAQLDAEANTRRAQMQRSSTARLAAIKSAPSAPPSVPRGKLTAEVSTKPAAKPELTSRQKRDADLASDRQRFEAQQRAARAKAVKEAEASGATAYGDRIRKARAEGHPGLKKKQPPVAVPGSR